MTMHKEEKMKLERKGIPRVFFKMGIAIFVFCFTLVTHNAFASCPKETIEGTLIEGDFGECELETSTTTPPIVGSGKVANFIAKAKHVGTPQSPQFVRGNCLYISKPVKAMSVLLSLVY